ncbi:MAG: hypothetical protein AVDCRST_MAG64-3450, partial [uncultured Phycisphaerae bacterium]
MNPAAHARVVPALLAGLLLLCCAARPAGAQNRWDEMDYGPFLGSSVTMPGANPEDPAGIVEKGVTVRLGTKDQPAAVCFDTDLLCYRAGWTGGWLKLMGTPFDGTHRPPEGSRPMPQGEIMFSTGSGPGWASPDGKWDDPRPRPYGPLPRAWGKYKGHYVHGDRVVFSYTVGDTDVLDLPAFERADDGQALFTRTLRLGASTKPLKLLVNQEVEKDRKLSFSLSYAAPVEAEFEEGRAFFVFPPRGKPTVYKVAIVRSQKPAQAAKAMLAVTDPTSLTTGGPARWPQTVETKGKLGAGDGPYAVDTLTLPDDNPWKSWMRVGGFDFFKDGKSAALSTWSGDVWVVSGVDDKLEKLTWKRYAAGLFQPLGLKVVDEKVYVLGRDGITRLHDVNGDN